jgi:shikimate 5-dehydrogenase
MKEGIKTVFVKEETYEKLEEIRQDLEKRYKKELEEKGYEELCSDIVIEFLMSYYFEEIDLEREGIKKVLVSKQTYEQLEKIKQILEKKYKEKLEKKGVKEISFDTVIDFLSRYYLG